MNQEVETVVPESLQGVVASGHTLQQMRNEFQSAVSMQRPRVDRLTEITKAVTHEAALCGEGFFYLWMVNDKRSGRKKPVQGVSIKGAYILQRNWGNNSIDTTVEENPAYYILHSTFLDFETNTRVTRPFRLGKDFTVHMKTDNEARKQDILFGIGVSKSQRNVILAGVPEWLIQKAFTEAQSGVKKKIQEALNKKGQDKFVESVMKRLKKIGVSETAVCEKFEIAKSSGLDLDMLVLISGDIQAIESGEETASALYPEPEGDDKPTARQKVEDKLDEKAENIRKEQDAQKEKQQTASQSQTEESKSASEPIGEGDPKKSEPADEAQNTEAAVKEIRKQITLLSHDFMKRNQLPQLIKIIQRHGFPEIIKIDDLDKAKEILAEAQKFIADGLA